MDSGPQESDRDRNPIDQRLVEADEDPEVGEDENHAKVSCRFCGEEHLGELYASPPDGFKVRWYCTEVERRGWRSVP